MSKMRLTTLNLDQDCLDIIGRHKNKSRYVRDCIKDHAQLVTDLDEAEQYLLQNRRMLQALVYAIQEAYQSNELVSLGAFIADFADETPLMIESYAQSGSLVSLIRAAAHRHGSV